MINISTSEQYHISIELSCDASSFNELVYHIPLYFLALDFALLPAGSLYVLTYCHNVLYILFVFLLITVLVLGQIDSK